MGPLHYMRQEISLTVEQGVKAGESFEEINQRVGDVSRNYGWKVSGSSIQGGRHRYSLVLIQQTTVEFTVERKKGKTDA